jgi:hypothetical protein
MPVPRSRGRHSANFLAALLIAGTMLGAKAWPQAASDFEGPIAFVGHGALFDRQGEEIQPTLAFVDAAQSHYRDLLLAIADREVRCRFLAVRDEVLDGYDFEDQVLLAAESYLLSWLVTEVVPGSSELLAKILALQSQLRWRLPSTSETDFDRALRRFELPREIKRKLDQNEVTNLQAPGGVAAAETDLGGAAYADLCEEKGVPLPPDWGTDAWTAHGVLAYEFIYETAQAEVFTALSADPEGVCIALPRFQLDTIEALGIICLGKSSSQACFWDNQKDYDKFYPRRGEVVPFGRFGGGTDLRITTGGECTDCHRGENPFVIHPGTALGRPALAELPLFADGWYEPIVPAGWELNDGPITSDGPCTACHVENGPGGRFPEASVGGTPRYCADVLEKAICATMPPGQPGSLSTDPQVAALLAMCDEEVPAACAVPKSSTPLLHGEILPILQLPLGEE